MGTICMKFNSLTIWNIGLPLQHCDLHSCRNISAFQFESVHPRQASELKESLKWYQDVANGWVTGVLCPKSNGTFSILRGDDTFNEFTYSIRLIIVYKLTIFYFCSLIIPRECQRNWIRKILYSVFLCREIVAHCDDTPNAPSRRVVKSVRYSRIF